LKKSHKHSKHSNRNSQHKAGKSPRDKDESHPSPVIAVVESSSPKQQPSRLILDGAHDRAKPASVSEDSKANANATITPTTTTTLETTTASTTTQQQFHANPNDFQPQQPSNVASPSTTTSATATTHQTGPIAYTAHHRAHIPKSHSLQELLLQHKQKNHPSGDRDNASESNPDNIATTQASSPGEQHSNQFSPSSSPDVNLSTNVESNAVKTTTTTPIESTANQLAEASEINNSTAKQHQASHSDASQGAPKQPETLSNTTTNPTDLTGVDGLMSQSAKSAKKSAQATSGDSTTTTAEATTSQSETETTATASTTTTDNTPRNQPASLHIGGDTHESIAAAGGSSFPSFDQQRRGSNSVRDGGDWEAPSPHFDSSTQQQQELQQQHSDSQSDVSPRKLKPEMGHQPMLSSSDSECRSEKAHVHEPEPLGSSNVLTGGEFQSTTTATASTHVPLSNDQNEENQNQNASGGAEGVASGDGHQHAPLRREESAFHERNDWQRVQQRPKQRPKVAVVGIAKEDGKEAPSGGMFDDMTSF
jgi:hypothetical protein